MISRLSLAFLAAGLAAGFAACDQVPLLAPTESTITLSATSRPDGTFEIKATVIESSGTAVHNGTLVLFSATIGRLEPREARTHNGTATATLSADGQSGVAEVRASSGSATMGDAEPLSIPLGDAAVARLQVSASPNPLPAGGGQSQVSALATDNAGTPLPSVLVTFATTAGTLSSSSATTNAKGEATVTLTTNVEATVTATAGGGGLGAGITGTVNVTVRELTGLTVGAPLVAPTAGAATALTVAPIGAGAIRNVTLNFGDGTSASLGTVASLVSVPHIYQSAGTFSAKATGTDLNGDTVSGSTSVVVLELPPLNLTVTIPLPAEDRVAEFYTVTVQDANGTTVPVEKTKWSWGDGTSSTTVNGLSTSHVYQQSGTYTLSVTAYAVDGRTGSSTVQVKVE